MITLPWVLDLGRVACVYDYCTRFDFEGFTELLMDRCNPEEVKETEAETATTTDLGGSGPWPLLLPWRWCCCGDWSSPQDGCQGGGIFVVPFDLGFLSLYKLSDSRHPDYVFSILGLEGASELWLGWILGLNPSEKNSLQLCSFRFFRLRPSSGVTEAIFKTCLVGTDFGRVRVQLLQGSLLWFSFIQVIPTHKVQKEELVHFCNH